MIKASAQGVDVVALTDHDTFDGLAEAATAAEKAGITLIPGVELSTVLDGRSVHLLGYGCDLDHEALLREMARIRQGRIQRLPTMCAQLREHGLKITLDDVRAVAPHVVSIGRPHLADALVAKGYVSSRDEAFAHWLNEGKPGYVERYAATLQRAIDLIHDAGGAAVIAHPWGRASQAVLGAEMLEHLVHTHGLDGLEVDHTDHDQYTRAQLHQQAVTLGIVETGSSDYHGTGKPDIELAVHTTEPRQFAALQERISHHSSTREAR